MKDKIKKCIIFGASKGGEKAFDILSRDYNVLGFSDNSEKKWGTEFCGKKVMEPSELTLYQDCEIIIASVYYAPIHEQLLSMGLKQVSVYYRLGNPAGWGTGRYQLLRLPEKRLFADCRGDEKLWKEIACDFAKNYARVGKDAKKEIIKQTDRKFVLFCAYIFPPMGGSGVQRSLKFVKYLRKFGYEPIVLTIGKNNERIMSDTTLLKEIPEDITVIRIDCEEYLPETLSTEKQKQIIHLYGGVVQSGVWMEEYLQSVERYHTQLIPDNHLMWVNECLCNIESLIDLTGIEIVFTTGNPFSIYILGYYIKEKYGIKWVQDYRDPWMTNRYYLENYYKSWEKTVDLQRVLERCLTRRADAIVTVEEDLRKEYFNEYQIPMEKVYAIANGYDEEDFAGIKRKGRNLKFTLCHNGTIYIDRDPTKLLHIINELILEGEIESSKIQWIFNGEVEKRWKDALGELDQFQIVQYNGYLSHTKSIQKAVNADVLVMLGIAGDELPQGCTGKMFEYMRMMRPILNISSDETSKSVIYKTGTGESFGYCDKEGIKNFIKRYYVAWQNQSEVNQFRRDEIEKYSREHATRMLAQIFDHLLVREES